MIVEKIVLTIAGSDSGGGAGIQADIKTMSAFGVFATSVVTAITAQNTLGVRMVSPLPNETVREQLYAVFEDFDVKAVKIGMLANPEIAHTVAEILERKKPENIVIDPVMVATNGDRLTHEKTKEVYQNRLFHLANMITPNIQEAEWLLGRTISTLDDMKAAATALLTYGSASVLVKGGHRIAEKMTDVWAYKNNLNSAIESLTLLLLTTDYCPSQNTHGTGCTLSSAIAALLALGKSPEEAVKIAKQYIYNAISHGKDVTLGHGHGAVQHFYALQHAQSL